jgi:TolA-binding protein
VGKERTSVTIDPDLKERLEAEPGVNASGLFNQMLRQYFNAGSVDGLTERIRDLEDRIEAKERERERLTEELETLREEREELLERKQERDQGANSELQKTVEELAEIATRKPEFWGPDNPALKNHAQDLGIPPSELYENVEEHVGGGGSGPSSPRDRARTDGGRDRP